MLKSILDLQEDTSLKSTKVTSYLLVSTMYLKNAFCSWEEKIRGWVKKSKKTIEKEVRGSYDSCSLMNGGSFERHMRESKHEKRDETYKKKDGSL